MGQEARQQEARLARIDEFLLAIGHRLRGVFGRRQVEGWPFSRCAAMRRMLRRKLLRSIGTEMARPITAPASSSAGWRQ
jgi:hypothetical protein